MMATLIGISASVAIAATPPTAMTTSGAIFGSTLPRGSSDAVAVNQFLGIPFGAPTKRWEDPVDFSGPYSQNPFNATMWGAACLQVLTANTTYGSEDCLRVNVWQPALARGLANSVELKPAVLKPVLFFIYGGSNQFGEAEPYNMSGLAAFHDVIAVNFNYRTGPIGWMAFDSDVASGASTGNFGILDIHAALRWVHREIASFGGDASRVAVHGQSSGGGLAELQLVSPDANGLFRSMISESGGLGASDLESSLANTRYMASITGCLRKNSATGKPYASKPCMQALPPLNVTSLTYVGGWGPTVDGVAIPADPMSMLREGRINRVDAAVFGAQTNDSFLFLSREYTLHGDVQPNSHEDGDLAHLNTSEYTDALLAQIPTSLSTRALALYPPLDPPLSNVTPPLDAIRNVQSLGRAQSDQMHCAARRRAKLFSAAAASTATASTATAAAAVATTGQGHGYVFRFDYWYHSNTACTAVPNFHLDYLGAVHQDEVTFVMGQPNFMEAGSCCGKWGLSQGQEACPHQAKCVSCYEPSLGEGYHAYFNDKEFQFARLVGGLWSSFAADGRPRRMHAAERVGSRASNHSSSLQSAAAAAADGAARWPDIGGGGIVLNADLSGGMVVEAELYNSPDVCALWDAVGDVKHDQVSMSSMQQGTRQRKMHERRRQQR